VVGKVMKIELSVPLKRADARICLEKPWNKWIARQLSTLTHIRSRPEARCNGTSTTFGGGSVATALGITGLMIQTDGKIAAIGDQTNEETGITTLTRARHRRINDGRYGK
jgi:hypothetical protein